VWPDRKTDLAETGGSECALDFEHRGLCRMEREGRDINFDCCPVALHSLTFIEAEAERLRFWLANGGGPLGFAEWRSQVMQRAGRLFHTDSH
jgi:hypothetical protein